MPVLKSVLAFAFLFNFLWVSAQSAENQILGKWMSLEKSVMVEVFRKTGGFGAKVIWFNEKLGSKVPMEDRLDTQNPNPKLRQRKILGMEVLNGLVYNADKKFWEKGQIYDAQSGRTWESSVHLLANGQMKVRGFWKFEWIGKSINFYRVK